MEVFESEMLSNQVSTKRKEKKAGRKGITQRRMSDPAARNLYGFYSVSSLHAAWDPLYSV